MSQAADLDRQDPLAPLRQRFLLPDGQAYLDGNSLGALPAHVPGVVERALREQWGGELIAAWNSHDWVGLPLRVGERIAPLIGAASGQVVCADSISVNLFKQLCAALLLTERRVVLTVDGDFPTDAYIAQGLQSLLGDARCTWRAVPAEQLTAALDEDVAVLLLTQVNYRSGELHDMRELTAAAQRVGALTLWDLAHSAGALPVELDDCGVDMAVGCGYKYLNGGPGAPAFVYLNQRHHATAQQPLSGWFGHASPFDFSADFEPAAGVERFQAGTPPILSMLSLEAALDVFDDVSVAALRAKSLALSDFFLARLAALGVTDTVTCITPIEHARRGSQISLRHASAWGISQALIEAGVIVDFRAPDVVRFGFAPLYNRFVDAEKAATVLADILADERYRAPRFSSRARVT